MSVATSNPFAILEDDVSSRPSTPAAPTSKAAAAPPAPTRGAQRARGGPASRGGRYYPRGGKPSASREDGQDTPEEPAGDAPKKRFDGEGRGRGRGRGRGGDRGGRGRPFDRHSQTGKTDTEKKVQQGWGNDEAEAKIEEEAANDATADASGWGPTTATDDVWAAPAADPEPTTPAPAEGGERVRRGRDRDEREPEEEDNTLTLEEYLKTQKELDLVPKLETRKANEGDDSIWKDAVAVTKKDDEEGAYFVGKTKQNAPKARTKKEKVLLEIDARFERPARGGRGRGDRGGDRGDRGGRSRGRGGRGRANGNGNGNGASPALNVDDQSAFPSLS